MAYAVKTLNPTAMYAAGSYLSPIYIAATGHQVQANLARCLHDSWATWTQDIAFQRLTWKYLMWLRLTLLLLGTHYWPIVKGINWWPVDSPHKGPVMWSKWFVVLCLVLFVLQVQFIDMIDLFTHILHSYSTKEGIIEPFRLQWWDNHTISFEERRKPRKIWVKQYLYQSTIVCNSRGIL